MESSGKKKMTRANSSQKARGGLSRYSIGGKCGNALCVYPDRVFHEIIPTRRYHPSVNDSPNDFLSTNDRPQDFKRTIQSQIFLTLE